MIFAPPASVQALLQTGFQLCQQERMEQAWNAFHEALRLDPNQALAHHMVGLIAMQAGQLEMGVESVRRSIALNPADPAAYGNLGNGLRDLGRPEEAMAAYDKALAIDPAFLDALNNRAILLARLGRHEEALRDYERGLAINPRAALLYNNRADVLCGLARRPEAIASYEQAIAVDPKMVEAWYGLANVLAEERKLKEALAAFDRAVALNPGMVQAHVNRGNLLIDLARPGQALDSYDRALALLGTSQGDADASASAYRAHTLSNRANALRMLDQHAEALESCELAVRIDPACADALVNRAVVLCELGRHEEAVADYEACLQRWPEMAAAGFGSALAYLAMGDFARGWQRYESRFDIRGSGRFVVERPFVQPYWLGQTPLAGKTILLHSEQGLGDTLQFCRYADIAKAEGARVILEVEAPLVRLLHSLNGADLVVEKGAAPPEFDLHASIMSLPRAFATSIDAVPADIPYLHPDPEMVRAWTQRLGERTRPRVGLVWAGGFRPHQPAVWSIRGRDIPLEMLAPLAEADVEFFSLQKGEPGERELTAVEAEGWRGPHMLNFTAELNDIADTAALVANLDLVIAVDTAIAHLAGALGKPVWILNRFDTCWRWMRERGDSPWYPTARLFRQKTIGDWAPVVREVAAALKAFAVAEPGRSRNPREP